MAKTSGSREARDKKNEAPMTTRMVDVERARKAAAERGLLSELKIRGVKLRNRIGVSPMCQYASEDGFANEWHLVHLGSRAAGGAALVLLEASAVEARGRISAQDLGIYRDEHIAMLGRIAGFLAGQGAVPGIQLAHAGRKASTRVPWEGGAQIPEEEGGWVPVAPSPIAFQQGEVTPHELSVAEIRQIVEAFAAAARRAQRAGFKIVEIHGAHGYLLHEFLSPLSNQRQDQYGGTLENRMRAPLEVIEAVRGAWPEENPLFLRISATDWVEGGWDLAQSVELAKRARALGVDVVDCSSGGAVAHARIPMAPGYQVPFAEAVRREARVMTAAVGMITEPRQADEIVREGKADLVLLARAMLRDPYWALHAEQELRGEAHPPVRYARAFSKK